MYLTTRSVALALGPLMAFSLPARDRPSGDPPGIRVPECQLAIAWVNKHLNELPTTEAELSSFSLAYRKAIFAAVPIRIQERLWREHLTAFVADDSPLTPMQQSIVAEAIANLHTFFDPAAPIGIRRERAKKFMTNAIGQFPRDVRVAVFSRLGADTAPLQTLNSLFSISPNASFLLDGRRLASQFVLPRASLQRCSCNVGWQDCLDGECAQQSPTCTETEQGCGPFWSDTCDGACAQ